MFRRKFLALAGAGMAGALAGCGGCGEEECEYEDEEEGGFGGEEDDSLWQPQTVDDVVYRNGPLVIGDMSKYGTGEMTRVYYTVELEPGRELGPGESVVTNFETAKGAVVDVADSEIGHEIAIRKRIWNDTSKFLDPFEGEVMFAYVQGGNEQSPWREDTIEQFIRTRSDLD